MAATNTITNLAQEVTAAGDIRDIRPLVEIPNPWLWLWVVLGALAIVAIGFWISRMLKQRATAAPAVPPIPAHIRARQRLEAALKFIREPKQFTTAVSGALRSYLEEAFELRAPEQTTEEFLVDLQDSAMLSPVQKTSLRDFLQSCDMVKFAQYKPRESELRELHSYALELVTQTEPSPAVTDDEAPTAHQASSQSSTPMESRARDKVGVVNGQS